MYLHIRFSSLFLYAKSSEGIGNDVGCCLDHLVLSKHHAALASQFSFSKG